ncbi:MAG TPA: hypothetical protein VJB06_00820 [archaeon]|nr:hypothetical protein [archaeon]
MDKEFEEFNDTEKSKELAADKKDYTSVKYGVFMEKINTKLRRIMLTNPFVQKSELVELLKATVSIEKDIGNDKELDNKVKTDLVTRLDTFAWFMTSMLDEITDLEKASKNQEKVEGELIEKDQNYFG